MNRDFIVTKEHRRFAEFATAVRKEVTIGICHGDAGVGTTLSARRYAHWDTLEPFIDEWGPRSEDDLKHYAAANRSRTAFYTPEVLPKPRDLMREIEFYRAKVGICVYEHLCATGKVTDRYVPRTIQYTELLIIDEAERLTRTALELLRDLHDREHLAIILIDMPGIDQRFRHYPQLYSRLGFAHRYRASAAKSSCSSSPATGNDSATSSTPTTSPTLKPSPRSNASPAGTSASSNASSPRTTAC